MSSVFQNIDPPTPLTARRVCILLVRGGGHTRWVESGGGGSIFWKTPETALYSTYVAVCLPVERVLELKLVLGLVVFGAGDVGPDLQQLQQLVRRVEGRRQLIVSQRCTPLGLRKSAIIKSGVFTKMLDMCTLYLSLNMKHLASRI